MTVYVDDMKRRYQRMVMCHMIGTDEAELHKMAQSIGVSRKWYQGDHYDICLAMRAKAVALGAVEITLRQAGCMVTVYKRTRRWVAPDEAIQVMRDLAAERRILEGSRP